VAGGRQQVAGSAHITAARREWLSGAAWCSVVPCVAVLDQRLSPQQDMGGCVSSDTTLVTRFWSGCSMLQ